MYLDLVNWKLAQLPGIGSIDLDSLMGGMPVYFVGYTLPKTHHGPHKQSDKNYAFKFLIDNVRRPHHQQQQRPQQQSSSFWW